MFRIHPRQNGFDLSITDHFLEVHVSEDDEICLYCRCDITRGQGVNAYNLSPGEKLVNAPYLPKLPKQKMAKDKAEPSCPCWHCMAKDQIKECPPAKPVLQTIKVKVVFLNLEKDKNKTDATKKDQ